MSARGAVYGLQSVYTRFMGISGPTLRDSYHLGQTISNDYGRPYQTGFNNITGFSTLNELGSIFAYVRGEYQHSPSATGYSLALASQLSREIDSFPMLLPTDHRQRFPQGPIAAQNHFGWLRPRFPFICLATRSRVARRTHGLGPATGRRNGMVQQRREHLLVSHQSR